MPPYNNMLQDYPYLLILDKEYALVDWYPASCEEIVYKEFAGKNVHVVKATSLPWLEPIELEAGVYLPVAFYYKASVCIAIVFEQQGETDLRYYAVHHMNNGKNHTVKFISYRQAAEYVGTLA